MLFRSLTPNRARKQHTTGCALQNNNNRAASVQRGGGLIGYQRSGLSLLILGIRNTSCPSHRFTSSGNAKICGRQPLDSRVTIRMPASFSLPSMLIIICLLGMPRRPSSCMGLKTGRSNKISSRGTACCEWVMPMIFCAKLQGRRPRAVRDRSRRKTAREPNASGHS